MPVALPASNLIYYLPAIYQEDAGLGRFLLAFEKVLLGRDDGVELPAPAPEEGGARAAFGLEQCIASMALLFDPMQTPEDFLPWLANWTAFTLRADLDPAKQRDFIANIIPRYVWRGTRQNLEELLKIFTVGTPTVTEATGDEVQIGVHSSIGKDMFLGGGPPHFFTVTIRFPKGLSADQLRRQRDIAVSLIELEKPAHTHYELKEEGIPTLRIGADPVLGGDYSSLGVDTILGQIPSQPA